MRVTDRKDWLNVWKEDKRSMVAVMRQNLATDITVGNYELFGLSIQSQMVEIHTYEMKYKAQLDAFEEMDEEEVNKWCYYDLKKCGAIG